VAAARTAASAELVLAEARRHHDVAMQMAMCATSSLADERHRHEELPTTTSPEPPAMLFPSPPLHRHIWMQSSIPMGVVAFNVAYRGGSNITFRRQ